MHPTGVSSSFSSKENLAEIFKVLLVKSVTSMRILMWARKDFPPLPPVFLVIRLLKKSHGYPPGQVFASAGRRWGGGTLATSDTPNFHLLATVTSNRVSLAATKPHSHLSAPDRNSRELIPLRSGGRKQGEGDGSSPWGGLGACQGQRGGSQGS